MTDTIPESPAPEPTPQPTPRPWQKRVERGMVIAVVSPLIAFALYTVVVYKWSYSEGDRSGILRKFSRKGWLCKTWEGELAMTTVPGVMPELWAFTVRDDSVPLRAPIQPVNHRFGASPSGAPPTVGDPVDSPVPGASGCTTANPRGTQVVTCEFEYVRAIGTVCDLRLRSSRWRVGPQFLVHVPQELSRPRRAGEVRRLLVNDRHLQALGVGLPRPDDIHMHAPASCRRAESNSVSIHSRWRIHCVWSANSGTICACPSTTTGLAVWPRAAIAAVPAAATSNATTNFFTWSYSRNARPSAGTSPHPTHQSQTHTVCHRRGTPQDGDYFLLASTSLGSAGRQTRGEYRLLVGLDAPEVLSGDAASGEVAFVRQDQESLGQTPMIQEHRGSLSAQKPEAIVQLLDPNPGDTLSVYLQATSGDLRPVVALRDYGGKPLRVGNLNGQANQASLEYTFPEGGSGYTLDIRAYQEGDHLTSGDYQLLVGRNAPQVLEGQGEHAAASGAERARLVLVRGLRWIPSHQRVRSFPEQRFGTASEQPLAGRRQVDETALGGHRTPVRHSMVHR